MADELERAEIGIIGVVTNKGCERWFGYALKTLA